MSRSVRLYEFGGPDVMKIEDVVIPDPAAGQVRLRVKAIGLNQTEVTFRSGRSSFKLSLPSQMGFEAAGVVDALGPDVTRFATGDRVALIPAYGVADYGLYGEVSLAPARSLVHVPKDVGWNEAAATWMPFGTAWAGLIDIGRLKAGEVVLIPAASSSVGLAAIQVANMIGATLVALTLTSRKADALRAAGASFVIATEEQDTPAEVMRLTNGKGADLVFDPIG